jgi:hypothetical protein
MFTLAVKALPRQTKVCSFLLPFFRLKSSNSTINFRIALILAAPSDLVVEAQARISSPVSGPN